MKKNYFGCFAVYLALFLLVLLAGCSLSESKAEGEAADRSIVLMTWNVHNLFDGKDNGYEYDEFLESAGWSTEKYLGRINSISVAIDSIEPRPDIIVLQEIESLKILEDLSFSMKEGFTWSHFANNPGAALGLGVLSRLPLSETKVHSITINGDTTPRPVLEVRIQSNDEAFVIFACHWKSKLGGDNATENVRMASARVILRRIRELQKKEPDVGIIITGDLNINHDDFYRRGANIICALLPDDPYCAEITGSLDAGSKRIAAVQKGFIVISKNKPPSPVHFPEGTVILFSPWTRDLENGSYYYRHNWETIDHFLISGHFFNNSGWEYERALVMNNNSHFVNSSGVPVSYNVRTGAGLSDHLPLLLVLKTVSD
uniref:Putative endonuclease/exonuclease/phosphatase n=1 Tax=uncultured bacterium contig00053 TaxID=1181537 RepID=A0A806JY77_9BACT|nr:putative endonuclease/exonuclease/phosphatase [uncultured bacterium contig00053]